MNINQVGNMKSKIIKELFKILQPYKQRYYENKQREQQADLEDYAQDKYYDR